MSCASELACLQDDAALTEGEVRAIKGFLRMRCDQRHEELQEVLQLIKAGQSSIKMSCEDQPSQLKCLIA